MLIYIYKKWLKSKNKMKALKILLICSIIELIYSNYPEDYSTIDFLTNPENNNNLNYDEVYLGSYYQSLSTTALPLNDLRNGIKIYPKKIGTPDNEVD